MAVGVGGGRSPVSTAFCPGCFAAAHHGEKDHQQDDRDQQQRPQVDQRQDQPLQEGHKGGPSAGEGVPQTLREGDARGGQGGDFAQRDVHGGVGDLPVQRTQLPGVAFQLILHVGKLALDLQQVGGGLGLGSQFGQPLPLGFQRVDPRLHVDVAGGHVLGALVQAQHAAALSGLLQKRAVVVHRHPHGIVKAAVLILGGTVHLAVFQPGPGVFHRGLQCILGGVEAGGLQFQVGVVDQLLGVLRCGDVLRQQGALGTARSHALGTHHVLGGRRGGGGAGGAAPGQQGGGQHEGRQTGNLLVHRGLLSQIHGAAQRPGSQAFSAL